MKLHQNFANFLLPTWKSLLLKLLSSNSNFSPCNLNIFFAHFFVQYFSIFFRKNSAFFSKTDYSGIPRKKRKLAQFFLRNAECLVDWKLRNFRTTIFFRWKSWSQLKNLTSDYNAMKCWQDMLPLLFCIFLKNFFNKQSNCLVFSALSFIGKMLKCYLSRSLIWTGNQGTASELSWNITFLKNVSSN